MRSFESVIVSFDIDWKWCGRMSNIIETKNLIYTYSKGMPDEKTAVNGISIGIEKGEFLGIIGHTGSGKSTFIQNLNGLLKPTSGQVFIDGEDMWANKNKLREYRFKVGLVFQYPEYQLFEETVFKDIAFGPRNMGLSEDEIKTRVARAAGYVGLTDEQLERSPFDLSGGQKRRAAIAGVLAMEPEVLILDEPNAGLDPAGLAEILEEIKRYHHERGNTVIIVSHSMDDVARYAGRVMVINEGELFCCDTAARVFSMAAELEAMGLAIPSVTGVLLRLNEMGHHLDAGAYTVEAAARSILKVVGSE